MNTFDSTFRSSDLDRTIHFGDSLIPQKKFRTITISFLIQNDNKIVCSDKQKLKVKSNRQIYKIKCACIANGRVERYKRQM